VANKKKKETLPQVDGLGPKDLKRIRWALRRAWSWSYPRRLALARAMHADGCPRCENKKCPSKGKPVPKVYPDHIKRVGEVDEGFIARLWCPSKGLQALCSKCHGAKTRLEKAIEKI